MKFSPEDFFTENFLLLLFYLMHIKKTKQKKQTKKKNKQEISSVKHLCQVASPGGRSLSTE